MKPKRLSGAQQRRRRRERERIAGGAALPMSVWRRVENLVTAADWRMELAAVYRDLRGGKIDTALAYCLAAVGKVAADMATKELDEKQLAALHRAVEAAAAGEPFPPALPAPAPGEATLADAAAADQPSVIEVEAVTVERPATPSDGLDDAITSTAIEVPS